MDFAKLLKARRSVRAFQTKAVPEETLASILEAANSAPSAGNLQAYDILVVKDAETRKKLAAACHDQSFIADAPISLLFFANPQRSKKYGERGASLYCIIDASIAASYAQLSISDAGLSTVWVGGFEQEEIMRITNAPANFIPVALFPVGYANEKPELHKKRKPEEGVKRERF